MNVGLRFTEGSYQGYIYPASGYMDVGGQEPGKRSQWHLGRVFGWPGPSDWSKRARTLGAQTLELGNEPNIETKWTIQEYIDYATNCSRRYRLDYNDDTQFCSAGMSPDGKHIEWYEAADNIPGVKYTGIHIYGQTLEDLIRLTESILAVTKRDVVISEINFGPGANVTINRDTWARAVLRPFLLNYVKTIPRIKAVLYFADTWKADVPIATPVDARGTQILNVLSEAANLPTDWNLGPGFKKCVRDLGWTALEDEIYHFPDNPTLKFSAARFDLGRATWGPQDNETVAVGIDGKIYSDGGNNPIDSSGKMVQVWPVLT